jgi:hypothetical protein
MKGMQGLLVAGLLGLLGVALNWIYLQGKTKDVASLRFLGIRADGGIQPGEIIREDQLEAVPIPERHAGNLKDYVYLYEERGTVVGITATRSYAAGDLLFRQDYRTPPAQLKLGPDEKLIWIPVNSSSFVPELIDPGDRIEFIIPIYQNQPLPPAGEDNVAAVPVQRVVRTETIGPFRVGSLGSRLASREVARGNRLSPSQERLIGIMVNQKDDRERDNAANLQGRILAGDYRDVGVALLVKAKS